MTDQPLPFGGVMKAMDIDKLMAQFKLPGVDMSSIVDARRKDIEALVEANRLAFESIQAVTRRQSEMLTQAMQSLQDNATGALANLSDPAKQAEVVKQTFDKTLANMKELAEMARRAQADVLAPVTQRVKQNLQGLMGPGQTG